MFPASQAVGKGNNAFSIRKATSCCITPQSFAPVIELLNQAVKDPQVVAIKMTVYRTGTDSVLITVPDSRRPNGKEVTVVVELMARFDEEDVSAERRLEEVGAHVVYGVVGYKSHLKALLISSPRRREIG